MTQVLKLSSYMLAILLFEGNCTPNQPATQEDNLMDSLRAIGDEALKKGQQTSDEVSDYQITTSDYDVKAKAGLNLRIEFANNNVLIAAHKSGSFLDALKAGSWNTPYLIAASKVLKIHDINQVNYSLTSNSLMNTKSIQDLVSDRISQENWSEMTLDVLAIYEEFV